METSEVTRYVSIAYRQDKKPMGLYVFEASNGDDAREEATHALPPQHILDSVGVTSIWFVTRVLTPESWPNCHRPNCPNKACLKLNSPFCYPHHIEITNGTKEV